MTKESVINRLKKHLNDLKKVSNADDFYIWRGLTLHTLVSIFPENTILLEDFEDIEAIEEDEYEREYDIHKDAKMIAHEIIANLIDNTEAFGIIEKSNGKVTHVNVTNNVEQKVHQEQEVRQQVDIRLKFIIDVFREELTGKQLKELKEIQESNEAPEVKKQRFFDKVKSFGIDVAAGLVSGILANPDFIQQLTH